MKYNNQTSTIKPTINTEGKLLLSLIIPCYNESARVEIMLQGLTEFQQQWQDDFEVIIVDDGSKDGTADKIQAAVDTSYPTLKQKIRIERMPANKGKGAALKIGVRLAKGDHILTLDADMSTRPVELINWQKREKDIFTNPYTVYIGSRKHKDGKVEALASRRIIGSIFNAIVHLCTSLNINDTQCGFKLYPREVALFLFDSMQTTGWAHDVELLYQADQNDINIVEMPVYWVNQPDSKVNVLWDSFKMFFSVLAISVRIWFYNSFVMPFRIPPTANAVQRKHIVYRGVFNILSVLLLIGMPLMSFQYAITGDEHCHFDYGNNIFNYFFHGDPSAQMYSEEGMQYYGGIFDFMTAFFYNVFHLWDHYTTMHFLNALVGAIGIIYAGKLAKLIGHWNTGILTMGLLVCSPSWFGHNFANPKDIPFSVGYIAGLYYIILYLRALPNPSFKHVFGLMCSIGWSIGVRIGGLLLIAYLGIFIVWFAVANRQIRDLFRLRIIRQIIVACICGYLLALVCWPYAHLGLISKPLESLKIMSHFFVNIGLIFESKRILSNQVPWYYIPKYIMLTAPVIVLIGFGLALLLLPFISQNRKNMMLFSLMVLFACVFPPAYVVYVKSSLYDGWRHFLFIYPPLVILASLGLTYFMDQKNRFIRYAAILLVVAGLILPVSFAIKYHPLEALYYNEVSGGMKNIYGNYETDYYMLGIKPATEWLMKNEHLENKKVIIATNCVYPLDAYLYLDHYNNLPWKYDKLYERFSDFRHDSLYDVYSKTYPGFADNFAVTPVYIRYYERYEKDWDYCILFSRFVDAIQITSGNWPPPETIHTIDVQGVPIAAILKRKTKKDLAAFTLLKEKKTAEAKSMFLASLQDYPNNELVWEALAKMYDAEDNLDSALYAARRTLTTYASDIDAYQVMGSVYIQKRMIDSAIILYRNLAQYNEAYSHLFLAYTYAATGHAPEAFQEIDNTLEIDPLNTQAYKLAMTIARRLKDEGKERYYYEREMKAYGDDGSDIPEGDDENEPQ